MQEKERAANHDEEYAHKQHEVEDVAACTIPLFVSCHI